MLERRDGQWVCLAVSPAWCTLFGLPPGALVGEPAGALLADRLFAEALGRLCDLAVLTHTPRRLPPIRLAGSPRVAQAWPVPHSTSRAPQVRLVLRPVPGLTLEDRSEEMPEGPPEPMEVEPDGRPLDPRSQLLVAVFDRDLRVVDVNDAVCLVSGMTRESIIGRTNRELGYPSVIADMWDCHHRQVLRTGQSRTIFYVLATVDGPRSYESRIIPERDAHGRILGVRVSSREILPGHIGPEHIGTDQVEPTVRDSARWERFEPVPTAPAAARHSIRTWLVASSAPCLDEVTLAVSELVTNAIMHAGTDVYLHVQYVGGTVRVEVRDGVDALPVMRSAGSVGGRGLRLVAVMASRWGADPLPGGGKVVWCEFGPGGPPKHPEIPTDSLVDFWSEG